MVTYFRYEDVPFHILADGTLVFNRINVDRRLAREYVMPKWVKDKVNKILDNKRLDDMHDVAAIQSLTNSIIVELNNALIPIMRSMRYKNSAISQYLSFERLLNGNDIAIFLPSFSVYSGSIVDSFVVELSEVYSNLRGHGVNLSDDDIITLERNVQDLMDSLKGVYSGWNAENQSRVEDMIEATKLKVINVVNEFLLDNFAGFYYKIMMDNTGISPYFSLSAEERSIVYDRDRILTMFSALGYPVMEDMDVKINVLEFVENLAGEASAEFVDGYDYENTHASLATNLSLINKIKFVSDNAIPLSSARGLRYPDIITSQLDFDMMYFDECAEMTTHEKVLSDLKDETGLPYYQLADYVVNVLEEIAGVYRLMLKEEVSLDVMYKSVYKAYEDMIRITSRKALKEFQQIEKEGPGFFGSKHMLQFNS